MVMARGSFSRWGKEWTDRVPAIVEAMRALPASATTASKLTFNLDHPMRPISRANSNRRRAV
jgi:hypothetical protein